MSRRVVIHWGLSSLHGWGVYGLNLALAWAGDPALEAATYYEVIPQHLTLDPLQAHALAQAVDEHAGHARLRGFATVRRGCARNYWRKSRKR